MYTAAIWRQFGVLNQEWREKGLFESNVADDRERAVYQIKGTLEDMLAYQARDLANGFEYEYIIMTPPRALKEELQTAMFGISVSSPSVPRAMEIITLLNTNRQFKNIFTYGVEGEQFVYNEDRQIERLNYNYNVNMDYTGNHFIADLLAGQNPNKWRIAMDHNLDVVNSVFLNLYFDQGRLNEESLASLSRLNSLGEEIRQAYLNGLPPRPADYEGETWEWDDYFFDYVTPAFDEAGARDLIANIRDQTSVEE
jgi:hypothetical protein